MSTNASSTSNISTPDGTATPDRSSTTLPVTPAVPEIGRVLQDLQEGTVENNDITDEPSSKKGRYIKLTYEHFERLMNTCTGQQAFISRLMESPDSVTLPTTNHPNKRPAYYTNAKFEEIASRAIKPTYDGSEDQLIPFLSRVDIRRQNEGWSSATYVQISDMTYDLTSNFASVSESDITRIVEARWTSPTVNVDKHTVDHETYNSRLLAMVIMNSITDDLLTTLLNRIAHHLRNDGTLLLWSISHNIHRNNIAFTEHVREKISLAT